ncbi:MAG: efflux RND transporter periplasmic adaptor subunit [Blastocatellia bacterium]|nr:efflux RND transporter periplasmic adaptor subunit [Blastocatellia bacterium]
MSSSVRLSSSSALQPVALALLAFSLVVSACKSDYPSSSASAVAGEAKPVQLIAIREQFLDRTVIANGTLAVDEEASVSFKVAGKIASISIDLGTVVKKGSVIAQLDTTDFELRVQQAEAALQQARVRLGLDPTGASDSIDPSTTGVVRQAKAVWDEAKSALDRARQLQKSGVIARSELDTVESQYRVADARYQDAIEEVRTRQAVLLQRRSEVAFAKQQRDDAVLRAPFDGAIAERMATSGEFVAAGAPVAKLVRLSPLRMRAEVPEREAAGVSVGQSVIVRTEGDSAEARGTVARVSPVITETNRVLVVEVEVDNSAGRLKPGRFARAEISTGGGGTALLVPAGAVVSFAGIRKVFAVRDGKAIERTIVVGRTSDGLIEVTEGLKAGDEIVADPTGLVVGQPVAAG